jgi:Rieske Fe-S protein
MSHSDAIKKDARDKLSRGQVLTAVITEVEEDGTAMSKYENIRTFVKAKDQELEWADTVQVKISDIRANSADALVLEKRNEEYQ